MIPHNLPGLSTALTVARAGLYIFPCEPYSKVPWHGLRSWSEAATNDPDIIRRSGWPEGANIGIACGPSGLLITDLDKHGRDDGVKAFTGLCREHEPDGDWPDTLIIRTPTDGFHHYFRNPGGLGNSRGNLPKGIDVRGDGGYVLAAGSVIDRRAYEGNHELQGIVGQGKPYTVDNEAPVLDLPRWLTHLLGTTPSGTPAGRYASTSARRWSWLPRDDKDLTAQLNSTTSMLTAQLPGDRNNKLFTAACRFGEAVAAGRLPADIAEDELIVAAERTGLPHWEIKRTIRSGFQRVGAL